MFFLRWMIELTDTICYSLANNQGISMLNDTHFYGTVHRLF